MSNLENEVKKAKKLSNLQMILAYVIYFVIFALIIINMLYIMGSWEAALNLSPPPIPYPLLVGLGLVLLVSIIILQTGFIYLLHRIKKQAIKEKERKTRNE
ncbi:MAG: hypothetical protein KIH08_00640 [Candidatus Freyarchaeota archaeon]|nr:hypothetical protein [Candidatus Jordarchaeia archaeon]MBS7267828.1 hypothetical protein [Candidatus Jordarchaeia archaeon]MBS7281045.1 hypothetical protein [Candidatus Jordarchaeia archaeon]